MDDRLTSKNNLSFFEWCAIYCHYLCDRHIGHPCCKVTKVNTKNNQYWLQSKMLKHLIENRCFIRVLFMYLLAHLEVLTG